MNVSLLVVAAIAVVLGYRLVIKTAVVTFVVLVGFIVVFVMHSTAANAQCRASHQSMTANCDAGEGLAPSRRYW